MHVHTVEIQQTLASGRLRDLYRSQNWFDSEELRLFLMRERNEITSRWFPFRGIRVATLRRAQEDSDYCFLSLVVNLQSLTLHRVTVELFECSTRSVEACDAAFRGAMESFSQVRFRPLLEWSTKRIDYALDISTDHTPLYVLLGKRSRLPRDFRVERDLPGSFYIGSESVRFNYYDKVHQLSNERILPERDRLMLEAEGILRVEVQCRDESKLHHIRNRLTELGQPDFGIRLRTFLNHNVSQWLVQDYYNQTIGYGDYYSLRAAEQRINAVQGMRRDKRQRIIRYLQLVDAVGSVEEARRLYAPGYQLPSGENVQGSLEALDNYRNRDLPALGINPVPIPEEHCIDFLPNPMPIHFRSTMRRNE